MQLRYYTAYGTHRCYEVLCIEVSSDRVRQWIDNLSEEDFTLIQKNCSLSTESEFNAVQEDKTLVNKREKLYRDYYKLWKSYYAVQKKSLENVRNGSATSSNFYEKLQSQWNDNGVYEMRNRLQKIEEGISSQNNPSQSDIYNEAKHQATVDYATNKIKAER